MSTNSTVYVLTRTRSNISLNDYFYELERWRNHDAFSTLQNIYLKLVPANQVPKALSHRHPEVVAVENGKYLTDEVLDFVQFYTTHGGDIEGIWIDIFCIKPGGHSLAQAFDYMGTIYQHAEVVPYWIIQPDYVNSLRRGWIFQESRFSRFDPVFLDILRRIGFEEGHGRMLPELSSERGFTFINSSINLDTFQHVDIYTPHADRTKWMDALTQYNPEFKSNIKTLLIQYLTANISREEDIIPATFGVVGQMSFNLSDLHAAGPIMFTSAMKTFEVQSTTGQLRFPRNRTFDSRLFNLFPEIAIDNFIFVKTSNDPLFLQLDEDELRIAVLLHNPSIPDSIVQKTVDRDLAAPVGPVICKISYRVIPRPALFAALGYEF